MNSCMNEAEMQDRDVKQGRSPKQECISELTTAMDHWCLLAPVHSEKPY